MDGAALTTIYNDKPANTPREDLDGGNDGLNADLHEQQSTFHLSAELF